MCVCVVGGRGKGGAHSMVHINFPRYCLKGCGCVCVCVCVCGGEGEGGAHSMVHINFPWYCMKGVGVCVVGGGGRGGTVAWCTLISLGIAEQWNPQINYCNVSKTFSMCRLVF